MPQLNIPSPQCHQYEASLPVLKEYSYGLTLLLSGEQAGRKIKAFRAVEVLRHLQDFHELVLKPRLLVGISFLA